MVASSALVGAGLTAAALWVFQERFAPGAAQDAGNVAAASPAPSGTRSGPSAGSNARSAGSNAHSGLQVYPLGPTAGEDSALKGGPAAAEAEQTATAREADERACRAAYADHRWRLAAEPCSAAAAAQPAIADLALMAAHGHFSHGRFATAQTWAARVVALDPAQADAYVIIGRGEEEAGHQDAARRAYRKYLHLAPRGWHAPRLRAALRERSESASDNAVPAGSSANDPS